MSRLAALAAQDVDAAAAAAECVVTTHHRLVETLRVGQTLAQIDRTILGILTDLNCKSCFKGYRVGKKPPFVSQACLSVNECVVHGTAPSYTKPMAEGDILKVDIGVWHRGFVGDAAWTYVFKAYPSDQARQLMQCGKESLARGVRMLTPANTWLAWAREVQTCVEREYRFHCVRGLGGHGYGRKTGEAFKDWGLHGPPFVANVVPAFPADWPEAAQRIRPGTLVAVEPMIAAGTGATRERDADWPVLSADGSLTVHYEHDVLITEGEPRVLTQGLTTLPDIVG
jgi:methionyl aminopeptidase